MSTSDELGLGGSRVRHRFLGGWGAVFAVVSGMLIAFAANELIAPVIGWLVGWLLHAGVMPVALAALSLLVNFTTALALIWASALLPDIVTREELKRLQRGEGDWVTLARECGRTVLSVAAFLLILSSPQSLIAARESVRDVLGLWPLLVLGLNFAAMLFVRGRRAARTRIEAFSTAAPS